jgi:hypothetical protein
VQPADVPPASGGTRPTTIGPLTSGLGRALENYSQELTEVGPPDKKKLVPKYSMEQLLSPDFLLPRPKTDKEKQQDSLSMLKMMAGMKGSGVKVLKVANGNE